MVFRGAPRKSNIDTKNDGVFNVSPFKYGYFGSMLVFGGVFFPKVMDEFGFVACEFAIG